MKTKPLTSLILALLLIPFHNVNAAENPLPQVQDKLLLAAAEKASATFRNFETIALTWKREISVDQGKTWKTHSTVMEVADNRIGAYSTKALSYQEDGNCYHYGELSIGEEKTVAISGMLPPGAPFSWETKGVLQDVVAFIRKSQVHHAEIPFIEKCQIIDEKNLLSPKHIVRLFNDGKGKTIFEIRATPDHGKKENEKEGKLYEVLWFDANTGALLRYFREIVKDGKVKSGINMTFEKHKNIMGWQFPLVKTESRPGWNIDGRESPATLERYSVVNEDVAINTLPKRSSSFYSVKIPVGAIVNDDIKGISYKHSGIAEDLSAGAVSQDLDKLLEESEKLKESAKK
jgi:hypothetical protein